jgi:hypothetical protein
MDSLYPVGNRSSIHRSGEYILFLRHTFPPLAAIHMREAGGAFRFFRDGRAGALPVVIRRICKITSY